MHDEERVGRGDTVVMGSFLGSIKGVGGVKSCFNFDRWQNSGCFNGFVAGAQLPYIPLGFISYKHLCIPKSALIFQQIKQFAKI